MLPECDQPSLGHHSNLHYRDASEEVLQVVPTFLLLNRHAEAEVGESKDRSMVGVD